MAEPRTLTIPLDRRREAERRKYVKLASSSSRYGATNHGRDAYTTVIAWQPRFVVDFGCGDNGFIRELRRRGIDGLGIDFANAGADIASPMHCVPLAGGIADVVTSFDALEHLLPEDVEPVLAEMRRQGRAGSPWTGRTFTRPSDRSIGGSNG
jgi:hypothetical protein